ncbi:hypothetical protein [Cellulomonas soli]|nr:hypothetical protein [Cellulomonas soli]NYI59142.1 hypothetical protein [Cellulomonas soli]
MLAGSGVLAWMIITGNYWLIWSAITSGISTVAQWTGVYDALTHVGAP